MYEICLYVNFMFQFEIKIDYPFTFQKKTFFFKIPSFWVFTKALGKYLGKYPKNIYLPTRYFHPTSLCRLSLGYSHSRFTIINCQKLK